MANPLKGEARMGRYTLAFSFGTFIAIEEKMGMKVPELLHSMGVGLGFGEMRDIILVALSKHHPEATEEDVIAAVDKVGVQAALLAVKKGIGGFFGDKEEKDENPPKPAQ